MSEALAIQFRRRLQWSLLSLRLGVVYVYCQGCQRRGDVKV